MEEVARVAEREAAGRAVVRDVAALVAEKASAVRGRRRGAMAAVMVVAVRVVAVRAAVATASAAVVAAYPTFYDHVFGCVASVVSANVQMVAGSTGR